MSGCATSGQSRNPAASGDPTTDILNATLHSGTRTKAVGELWRGVESGEIDREAARATLKAVAWATENPESLRLAALQTLVDDPQGEQDSRTLTRMMLPRGGGSEDVIAMLANTAADRGWTEVTPALVRSYAQFDISVEDAVRPERDALLRLHPGKSIDEIVYGVFLDPQTEAGPADMRFDERTRADAWDLLARLDPTGEQRARLITSTPTSGATPSTAATLAALRASVTDFRAVPITGEELRWVMQTHAREQAWWSQSAAAVRTIPAEATRLEFRHIEPIRWASIHRPQWLKASRDELLSQMESTLEVRTIIERRADRTNDGRPRGERIKDWISRLGWADALTLLVMNEAVNDPYVQKELIRQIVEDRADKTAEYGGVIEAVDGQGFDSVLYAPRPSQRVNDFTFVASQDMIDASNRGLAHYHFHAQRDNNEEYAGPSMGDVQYAARSGRTCLVITTVGKQRLNFDVYTPDGVVIDLGVFDVPQ